MSTATGRQSYLQIFYRFVAALLCSGFMIYLAGNIQPPCPGCGREHGWPMIYYREAGLVGDASWAWTGFIGDLALCMLLSMLFTLVWSMLAQGARASIDEASR